MPKDSDIKSVEDLKGKKVGVAEGSSANYNLLAQLDKAGLTYDDVQVENLQPADALAAFSAGHLDAWAIWEPLHVAGRARGRRPGDHHRQGRGQRLRLPGRLQGRPSRTRPPTAALKDYVARIARAQVWSHRRHKEDWAKVWAEETGLSRGHHPRRR